MVYNIENGFKWVQTRLVLIKGFFRILEKKTVKFQLSLTRMQSEIAFKKEEEEVEWKKKEEKKKKKPYSSSRYAKSSQGLLMLIFIIF